MSAQSPDKTVTQILQRLHIQPELQAELDRFRRSITVLFTDIKGSTAYFDRYGDAAGLAMVHMCNELQSQRVVEFGGRVIKTIGDAVMATFEVPKAGVAAAVEMQRDLVRFNTSKSEEDRVYLRIGVHFGQGIVKSNDVFGDVVNVASRIQSAAQPEQIVISDALLNELEGNQFKISPLGRFAFKGKGGEQELYEVVWNEERPAGNVGSGHTFIISMNTAPAVSYKLQHIKPDGTLGSLYSVPAGGLSVGRTEGDVRFPEDDRMLPLHARMTVQGGQLIAEDVSNGGEVMVRLIEPYLLQDGEILKIGRQMFCFCEERDAVAVAAATGTSIGQLASMMKGPAAELVRLNPQGSDPTIRYPISADVTTIGRERGTYVFPDDGFMSRAHAKVYQRGEDFFLEDLGSRNGTFAKVHGKAPVPNGSAVLIGRQLLKVVQNG